MKIALIGSRGIPARYSGFETFYEQLGVRLAARGHDVTVYNRAHFVRDVRGSYRGVRLVRLPSIPTKHGDTITHTFLSSLHALTQGYDIAYYCIVGNSPIAWIPRLAGARTLLNVDGEDWAREKWGTFARWYQLRCERIATRTANVIISDAQGVAKRYRERYGAETVFVPYGANVAHDARTDALRRWGLEPGRYVLYVGRFVPENAIDVLIEAFRGLDTPMRLVVVGDAPFAEDYKRRLRELAAGDPRIVFTGYAFGDDYAQLSSHPYLYVQPSGVDGTRPALLDQMGFGNCVLVRNSAVNLEVIGDCGAYFDRHAPVESLRARLAELLAATGEVERLRGRVRGRIERYYNWEWVTSFYEDLFARMREGRSPCSYDEFIAGAPRAPVPTGPPGPAAPPVRVNVLGVGLHPLDPETAVRCVVDAARRSVGYVTCTSVHGVMECQRDGALRRIHNEALLTVPDGMPTVWMGQEQGYLRMRRVYGPDLMLAVLAATASPEAGVRSPESGVRSPESGVLSPEVGSQRSEVGDSRRDAEARGGEGRQGPEVGGQTVGDQSACAEPPPQECGLETTDYGLQPVAAASEIGGLRSEISGGIADDRSGCVDPCPQDYGLQTTDYGLQPAACSLSPAASLAHFLYGSTPEVLEKLVANLSARFPGLRIAGTYSPPFRPLTEEEWPETIERVVSSGASFVWVGMSTPKQERFMAEFVRRLRLRAQAGDEDDSRKDAETRSGEGREEQRSEVRGQRSEAGDRREATWSERGGFRPQTHDRRLPTSDCSLQPAASGLVLIGVGAAFDLHAGLKRDAPRWMQNAGLQWFHRLCQEPRRLAPRYFRIVPGFLWRATLQVLGLERFEMETGEGG